MPHEKQKPLWFTQQDEKQKLVCLYSNQASRQQQERLVVMPHTVSPLKCLDPDLEKHLAENSVIGDPEVIGHFVSLLVDPSTPKDI